MTLPFCIDFTKVFLFEFYSYEYRSYTSNARLVLYYLPGNISTLVANEENFEEREKKVAGTGKPLRSYELNFVYFSRRHTFMTFCFIKVMCAELNMNIRRVYEILTRKLLRVSGKFAGIVIHCRKQQQGVVYLFFIRNVTNGEEGAGSCLL